MKRGAFFGLLVVLLFAVLADAVFSQTVPVVRFRNRGAQYQIGDDDEVLIQVNIWGFVRMPGQYLVPSDTDLISLISFAGGPTEDADITEVKLIRTVHLNNPDREEKKKIYVYNVKKFLETGDKQMNPQLMPNDTIIIRGSTVHLISRMLEFASKLTFIAQIYFWISVAKRY